MNVCSVRVYQCKYFSIYIPLCACITIFMNICYLCIYVCMYVSVVCDKMLCYLYAVCMYVCMYAYIGYVPGRMRWLPTTLCRCYLSLSS